MKRFIYLSIIAALAGTVWYGAMVSAQAPPAAAPATAPAASQAVRPRIALVNIAKVLREFAKAKADGQILTNKRQYYLELIKPRRELMAQKQKQHTQQQVPAEKERLEAEIRKLGRECEDIEGEAQRVLGEMTDHTIMDVYQNIKLVIEKIAVHNNLDLVMCYPDASTPEDEKRTALAQMKLQTPALIPFYHRNMDITEVVVKTLNASYPAPPVPTPPTPAPSTSPSPMTGNVPMGGGVTPVNYPPKR